MLIFLHIPKTGGTTFRSILENSFGIRNCHTNSTTKASFNQADFDFVKKVFPWLRSIAGHNLVNPAQLSVANPFFMTILREPVARVISHYQDSVLRGNNQTGFEESLRCSENLENLQVKLLAGERNLDKAKRFLERCAFIGLTRKFDLSLSVLERLSPWKLNLQYTKKTVARTNEIRDSLLRDERKLELARKYNQLDLELYQFAVNEVFPRLCQKAGVNPADKTPSYQTCRRERFRKFQIGQLYNRLFRQLCKARFKFIYPEDTRPLLGNTAKDIFAPLLQKTPRRR